MYLFFTNLNLLTSIIKKSTVFFKSLLAVIFYVGVELKYMQSYMIFICIFNSTNYIYFYATFYVTLINP